MPIMTQAVHGWRIWLSADARRGGRLVICGEAEDYPASRASVRLAVAGNGIAHSKGGRPWGKSQSGGRTPTTSRSTTKTMAPAGDAGVVQVHDAFTIAEPLRREALGLGGGVALVVSR
jgi:hypothetical protein